MRPILLSLSGFLLFVSSVGAGDYDNIDRTILKEPVYKSGAPQYLLLLFGPQKKRVWLVIDGKTAYIDRHSDGDLTAADDCIEDFVERLDEHKFTIEIPDSTVNSSYVITRISIPSNSGESPDRHLAISVNVIGQAKYRQYSDSVLRNTPQQAAISHFAGPLTAATKTINWKLSPNTKLHLGQNPNRIDLVVGTMDADHKCWVVVCSDNGDREMPAFPLQFPKVTVEFPPKTAGGSPVTEIFRLDKFCCGCLFYGMVVVPEDAGIGRAKLTYSFGDWREGHVIPSTIELPVISADEAAQAEKKAQTEKDASG